ncbi:MAG: glutathione S-transferase family protein [Hyphomicrobium sp.]|nr:glutathione S-transferase family protein [Hyphomicrobium sp.]
MLKLVIANKLYSSWSLRPWMVMRAFDIPFEEIIIPLRMPDSRERVLAVSPSGKVPALIAGGQTIWESLAIIEYVADAFPDKAIWPRDINVRAYARSIANEMHGGFPALRQACPMNLGGRYATPELTDTVAQNVARIEAIWAEARGQFAADGPYLCGAFSAADAMYAPIATRLDTYQVPVTTATRAYIDTILSHPAFVAWRAAALKETWTIQDYDAGHRLVENHR